MDKNKSDWTFFSNHGHVFFVLAINPEIVLREVARLVGITERAVQGIVQDLENGGYIERIRQGRSNQYIIKPQKSLRHPLEANVKLDDLTQLIKKAKSKK